MLGEADAEKSSREKKGRVDEVYRTRPKSTLTSVLSGLKAAPDPQKVQTRARLEILASTALCVPRARPRISVHPHEPNGSSVKLWAWSKNFVWEDHVLWPQRARRSVPRPTLVHIPGEERGDKKIDRGCKFT